MDHPKANRPAKLKQWSEENMLTALQAVREGREGTFGINRAALEQLQL